MTMMMMIMTMLILMYHRVTSEGLRVAGSYQLDMVQVMRCWKVGEASDVGEAAVLNCSLLIRRVCGCRQTDKHNDAISQTCCS